MKLKVDTIKTVFSSLNENEKYTVLQDLMKEAGIKSICQIPTIVTEQDAYRTRFNNFCWKEYLILKILIKIL